MWRLLLAIALFAAACSDPESPGDGGVIVREDAAVLLDAAAPDATLGPVTCTCDDDEQCAECFQHLGRCCYDDPTFDGRYAPILANCEANPSCKACCKECVALSCDEIKQRGSCPNLRLEE